jgi:ADP-ribose pyrophosphatase
VPDEKVSWSVDWPEYNPVEYTYPKYFEPDRPDYVDPPSPLEIKNWNALDGKIDRRSQMGEYQIINGVPRNPVGRTGMTGLLTIALLNC